MNTEEQPEQDEVPWKTRAWDATKDFVWELSKVIVLSLAIIVPIRYFLIQPFYVRGASMEPNFHDHEYLIIDEVSYGIRIPFTDVLLPFSDPIRGEIVVFRYPRDPRQYFIKRVIGLPGETIIIRDGSIFVSNRLYPQGVALDEPYLASGTVTHGESSTTLGANEYYVMGDNRGSSMDSRSFGAVKRIEIVGRTVLRGWPFDRFTYFTPPAYNL